MEKGGWIWVKRYVAPAVFLILGFVAGSQMNLERDSSLLGSPVRVKDENFRLISPLVLSDSTNSPENSFDPLADKLKAASYDYLNSTPGADKVSIYFRDLNTGKWTGVNENENYDPASLLKVPIMMAWYLRAESDPSVLDRTFIYKRSPEDVGGSEFNLLTPGRSYSVSELLKAMIERSDNGAKNILLLNVDQKILDKVFSDLGINISDNDPTSRYQISAKTYSIFFRALYNATYLTKEYSEKALEMLSATNFSEGLLAGVPTSTNVAHKFGQYIGSRGAIELHDCGIIYHPENPYILCVMTKGSSGFSPLKSVIAKISQTAHGEADRNYR